MALILITFTATPRGRREEALGQLRAEPLRQERLGHRAPGPVLLAGVPTGPRSCWTSPTCATSTPRSTASRLGAGPRSAPRRLHDRALPRRGARLAGLHAAARAAADQPSPGGPGHRLRARLLPPAADPHRHDVRRVRQPLDRGARRGGHADHGWRLLRLPLGPHRQRLAGLDGSRCRQPRVRLGAGPWSRGRRPTSPTSPARAASRPSSRSRRSVPCSWPGPRCGGCPLSTCCRRPPGSYRLRASVPRPADLPSWAYDGPGRDSPRRFRRTSSSGTTESSRSIRRTTETSRTIRLGCGSAHPTRLSCC